MTSPALMKLSESAHSDDKHHVFISYDGDIQTTRVTVDKFGFLESLNYLGSNLGLWPGLGLFQLIEGAAAFVFSLSITKICFRIIVKPWSKSEPLSQQTPNLNKSLPNKEEFGPMADTKINECSVKNVSEHYQSTLTFKSRVDKYFGESRRGVKS